MTSRNLRWQLIGVVLTILLLSGCSAAATPTDTPIPTESPTANPTPVPPTPIPPLVVGDPERGREIYETGAGLIGSDLGHGCSACHSLDGSVGKGAEQGPSFQGISKRAGDRVPGLSAVEYLRQSILKPSTYVVDGFDDNMTTNFRYFLSEEDVDDVVTFLLTQ